MFLQGLLAPADFVGLSLGVSQQVASTGKGDVHGGIYETFCWATLAGDLEMSEKSKTLAIFKTIVFFEKGSLTGRHTCFRFFPKVLACAGSQDSSV